MSKSRYLPPRLTPRTPPRALSQMDELELERDVHDEHIDQQFEKDSDEFEPFQLKAPPPRAGYVQRWVRVLLGGQQDINASHSHMEGWRPRTEQLPDNFKPSNFRFGDVNSNVDYIQIGDLVLMEKPIARHKKRMAYYAKKDQQVVSAVDEELNAVEHARHPIHRDRKTQVSGGRRDLPNVSSEGEAGDDLDDY